MTLTLHSLISLQKLQVQITASNKIIIYCFMLATRLLHFMRMWNFPVSTLHAIQYSRRLLSTAVKSTFASNIELFINQKDGLSRQELTRKETRYQTWWSTSWQCCSSNIQNDKRIPNLKIWIFVSPCVWVLKFYRFRFDAYFSVLKIKLTVSLLLDLAASYITL